MKDAHGSGGAADQDTAIEGGNIDRLAAGAAADRHAVQRTVGDAGAGHALEIDLHPGEREVGAGEIVDRDVVGAAEGVEVDLLDAVEVHRDVGDVAGEAHPLAVRRDRDGLGDIRAVE
jgi:hypothetical protein